MRNTYGPLICMASTIALAVVFFHRITTTRHERATMNARRRRNLITIYETPSCDAPCVSAAFTFPITAASVLAHVSGRTAPTSLKLSTA